MIEALFIGNECCDGRIVNTNQQFLAEQLYSNGYFLSKSVTVSDDETDLLNAFKHHFLTADLLITTGGLGPTEDDRTTRILANACNLDLIRHHDVLSTIHTYFKSTGRSMPDENAKQADFPDGAQIIHNPLGTAPGFYLAHRHNAHTTHIFCCPGVPKEMKPMFLTHILPKLETLIPHLKNPVHTHLFRCFGAGESHCAERLRSLYPLPDGFSISFQVKFPEIQIRLHTNLATHSDPNHRNPLIRTIEHALGSLCFSQQPNISLPHLIMDQYTLSKKTIALAESCTGGRIASALTSIPGASAVLDQSVIAYSNSSKTSLLGVDDGLLTEHGAVSAEVAKAMATGILNLSGADVGLSVTGIAGPDGGCPDKPVGTVYFGLASKSGAQSFQKLFSGNRDRIQLLSSWVGLSLLMNENNALDGLTSK